MSDRSQDNSSPLGPIDPDALEELTTNMPLGPGINCFTIYWPRRGDTLDADEQDDPILDQARRTGHACNRRFGELVYDWFPLGWKRSSTEEKNRSPEDQGLINWHQSTILHAPQYSAYYQMMSWWITDPDAHGYRTLDKDGTNKDSVCQIKLLCAIEEQKLLLQKITEPCAACRTKLKDGLNGRLDEGPEVQRIIKEFLESIKVMGSPVVESPVGTPPT